MAELLLWEYRSIVIRIHFCIVIISPFWVDVPTARQGIRFCTKTTRAEADKQIEVAKVFGPASLATREDFCSGEVFKIFVISYNVNWGSRAFKEVSPDTKSVENGQKFFIVSVVIQFRACKSAGMESHRMNFTRVGLNGEDGAKSIIGGVSLDNDGFVGNPVGKDRGGCESGLKGFECLTGFSCKIPSNTLASEAGKGNHDVGIVGNEAAVEVSETQKGLNVLDFLWFRPILDSLDFSGRHLQTICGDDKAEVLDRVDREKTFIRADIKSVLSEALEYFSNVFFVFFGIIGINEYVVKIDDDADIK